MSNEIKNNIDVRNKTFFELFFSILRKYSLSLINFFYSQLKKVGRSVTPTHSHNYHSSTIFKSICSKVCSVISFFGKIYVTVICSKMIIFAIAKFCIYNLVFKYFYLI